MNQLVEKGFITQAGVDNVFGGQNGSAKIFEELKNGKVSGHYSDIVKQFAITMSYYSMAGYQYLRENLNVPLPSIRTIQSWCSSVKGQPGVTSESISAIKEFIAKRKMEGKETFFCLMMDEMSIKQAIEECNGEIYGYVISVPVQRTRSV